MTNPRQPDFDVIERPTEKTKTKKPPMYNVIMLNDDYTTMEFVEFVLQAIFHRSQADSKKITWEIHSEGKGICGTYTLEVAEEKATEVLALAYKHQFPLQCTLEKA